MAKKDRPYKGPRSARDPRLREYMGGEGPPVVRDNRKLQMTPTQRRIIQSPNFPRGPMQGLDMPGKAWDPWDGPRIGGPTNRMIRGGKWGMGTLAVGGGATAIHRNRKVKKMDVRKNADIPFKGVRTSAAPKGTRKPGQLPFTEHFTNPGASPRRQGVLRVTGRTKNPRNAVEHFGKSALPTRVTSVQPRTPQGRYVGTANDLQVFHPKFSSKNRQPRTTTLGHWKKSNPDQYAAGFKKSLFGGGAETSLALTGTIGMGAFAANQGRRGKRF